MTPKGDDEPVLLSGGNPQIPKGEGDGPVQDYIAAMPGWKRAVGERLDALIVEAVPEQLADLGHPVADRLWVDEQVGGDLIATSAVQQP